VAYGPGPRSLAEIGSRNILEYVSQTLEHEEANPTMVKEIKKAEDEANGDAD
jgi:hypothetical protein